MRKALRNRKVLRYQATKSITNAHFHTWWLTPVILATQEAEIKRTVAKSQPGQIVFKTLS
jgi:hypothetical protein